MDVESPIALYAPTLCVVHSQLPIAMRLPLSYILCRLLEKAQQFWEAASKLQGE